MAANFVTLSKRKADFDCDAELTAFTESYPWVAIKSSEPDFHPDGFSLIRAEFEQEIYTLDEHLTPDNRQFIDDKYGKFLDQLETKCRRLANTLVIQATNEAYARNPIDLSGYGSHDEAPQVDAGMPQLDAGMPQVDAAIPQVDAGMPQLDAGMPQVAAGIPRADAVAAAALTILPPVNFNEHATVCYICTDSPARYLWNPCGHFGLCFECYYRCYRMGDGRGSELAECHICNEGTYPDFPMIPLHCQIGFQNEVIN